MKIRRRPPNPGIKVANLEYGILHEDSEPRNILEKIVWVKDREIELSRQRLSLEELKSQISSLSAPRDFLSALRFVSNPPAVIAEVKKASPSKGIIREDFDPKAIALAYKQGGASCISVLTDKSFFQGGFDVLIEVRAIVDLPILCKDFILSPYQLYQARAAGADAVLLITAILSDQDLIYLNKVSKNLGLCVLVEVHNYEEIERVLKLNCFSLIGINNRDLTDFNTDLGTTERLIEKYKSQLNEKNILIVSESGLFCHTDLIRVYSAGAGAVLVGESLMRQTDVETALRKLIRGVEP